MIKSVDTNNKSSLYIVCICLSFFGLAAILLAMPYKLDLITSIGTYAIGISAAICYVKYICDNYTKTKLSGVMSVLLLVFVVAAMFVNRSSLMVDIIKILCFFEIPIFMLCTGEVNSKVLTKIILILQYIISFNYILLSFTDKARAYYGEYGLRIIEELTLGYKNPNETAIYLLTCFFSLLVGFLYFKKLIVKCLFLANAVVIYRFIWQTNSRTGIIIATIGFILLFLIKFIKVNRTITITSLLIPIIIIFLIYNYNDQLVELKILGESAETGRINVFNQVFDNMDLSAFLLGNFSKFGFSNMHNAYLSVFATIGIFGVIIYAVFMFISLIDITCKINSDPYGKFAFFGVLLLMIQSSVEAALLVSGSSFAMSFIGLYFIALDNSKNTCQ